MSVEEIGEKNRRFSPGGGFGVTVGTPDVRNELHFKGGLVIVVLPSWRSRGNGEDLGRRGRKAGRSLRVQRLHRGEGVHRLPQELNLSPFRNESSREQMMDRTSSSGSLRVRDVFGEDLVGRHDQDLRVLRFEAEA